MKYGYLLQSSNFLIGSLIKYNKNVSDIHKCLPSQIALLLLWYTGMPSPTWPWRLFFDIQQNIGVKILKTPNFRAGEAYPPKCYNAISYIGPTPSPGYKYPSSKCALTIHKSARTHEYLNRFSKYDHCLSLIINVTKCSKI